MDMYSLPMLVNDFKDVDQYNCPFESEDLFQQLKCSILKGHLPTLEQLSTQVTNQEYWKSRQLEDISVWSSSCPPKNYLLDLAAKLGRADCVEFLLEKGAKEDSIPDNFGVWEEWHSSYTMFVACFH